MHNRYLRSNIYIIIYVLLFISCEHKRNIQKDLLILTSKSIILPENSIVISPKNNLERIDFKQGFLKLIIYTSPKDCSSCGINNIHVWDKYLEYAELFNGRLWWFPIFRQIFV